MFVSLIFLKAITERLAEMWASRYSVVIHSVASSVFGEGRGEFCSREEYISNLVISNKIKIKLVVRKLILLGPGTGGVVGGI